MGQLAACLEETNLRHEEQLLLCSSRTSMESDRAERITALLEKDIDWEYLIRVARQHGVMPLLYRSLHTVCPEAIPKIILERLRHNFYANATRNFLLTNELLKLLRIFEAHKVPAIPYKGPVLAASVYGDLALRQFSDLDILVRERDYHRAQDVLISRQYRVKSDCGWESTLVDSRGNVVVDLHKAMTQPEFPSPLSFEYLWHRLQSINLVGRIAPNLNPEDTLLVLVIEIARDAGTDWLGLVKICDIAELLCRHEHVDLAKALKQARRLGGERMLLVSLGLARSLLGIRLPEEIIRKTQSHPSIAWLVETASGQLFERHDGTSTRREQLAQFRWHVREHLRDKYHCHPDKYPYYFRYVYDVIIPGASDQRLLPLPRQLSFLYYLIRPIRLLGKYGLRLFARRHEQTS